MASNRSTGTPCSASTSAAIKPAGPPPITAARKGEEVTGGLSRPRRAQWHVSANSPNPSDVTVLQWQEAGGQRQARWRSESGWPAPRRVQLADDQMPADVAYRLA